MVQFYHFAHPIYLAFSAVLIAFLDYFVTKETHFTVLIIAFFVYLTLLTIICLADKEWLYLVFHTRKFQSRFIFYRVHHRTFVHNYSKD